MGPGRRLNALAKREGCPYSWTQLEAIAHENAWKDRAQAWDAHLDTMRTKAIETEVQEDAKAIARRHAKALRLAFSISERELELLHTAAKNQTMHGLINPGEARRLLETAIKLERLMIGEVTERVDTGPDLSRLDLEDLRRLKDMAKKTEAS